MSAADVIKGRAGRPFTIHVELGKIREFARATKSTDPAYFTTDDPVSPGTYLAVLHHWRTGESSPWAGADRNMARVLHGGQEFIFHGEPPRAGMRLLARSRIDDVYQKRGRRGGVMTFTVIVTEFFDDAGRLVAETASTSIETGGSAAGER